MGTGGHWVHCIISHLSVDWSQSIVQKYTVGVVILLQSNCNDSFCSEILGLGLWFFAERLRVYLKKIQNIKSLNITLDQLIIVVIL